MSSVPSRNRRTKDEQGSSHPFKDDGDALADADAHSAEGVAAVRAQELIKRGGDKARAACAEWMTDGNGAAIWIDVCGVIGNSEVSQNGERLRREGFIELDDVHLVERQARFR